MSELSDYPPDQLLVFDMSEGFVPATPSEIAAAHPKCFTCGHWHYDTDDHSGDIGFCHFWTNEMGTTDYCPHHTALTGESDG